MSSTITKTCVTCFYQSVFSLLYSTGSSQLSNEKHSNGIYMVKSWMSYLGQHLLFSVNSKRKKKNNNCREKKKKHLTRVRCHQLYLEQIMYPSQNISECSFQKIMLNDDKRIYYLVYWLYIEDICWEAFAFQTNCILNANVQEYHSDMSCWYHKSTQHPPTVPPALFSLRAVRSDRRLPYCMKFYTKILHKNCCTCFLLVL